MREGPQLYIRTLEGFAPKSESARAFHAGSKLGQTVLLNGRRPRNAGHHRKLFALLKLMVDNTEDFANTTDALLGLKAVLGYGQWKKLHKDASREIFIPDSIAFENMGQDEFQRFYDSAVAAIRRWWIPVEDAELREAVEAFGN